MAAHTTGLHQPALATTMRAVAAAALLAVITGCSDDDDPVDAGSKDAAARDSGSKDSGSKDSGSKDSSSKDSGDGSIERDASSNEKDASMDKDAGLECKGSVSVPHWNPEFRWPASATRVPLDVYCKTGCPSSLQDYLQALKCEELDDAGIQDIAMGNDLSDGGNPNDLVLRSEGCGTVQFSTIPPGWPRDFNFDAMTGKLIGAARLDDIGTPLPGVACESAGWIAGEFRGSCPGEVLMLCMFR